ncbi:MAG: glycosyltransferase [Synergistaceae bacterium]|nr:glycosyltransferase [Synergistaceae bacterium]
MRILYVVPGFDEGGAEFHVLNLIRELSKRGHDITLASSGGHLERELPEGIRSIHLPLWRKNPLVVLYCAFRLSRLGRFDVIHAHSRVPAWAAWLAARLTGSKWLMTAHAFYSHNPGLLPLRHADGVICVSEAVRHDLAGYLPQNVITIPNGITPPKFRHRGSARNRLLFVGRLTRLKGLDDALRALSELKGYAWSLDVLGEGSQHAELEELAESLGIGERVRFHGAVSNDDAEEFMAFSSCLLFPSHSEGMGLVVLEALSIGLPVIASDLEALRDFAEGELVPDGDVSAWREAIRRFFEEGTASPLNPEKIITVQEMACRVEKFCLSVLEQ